MLKKTLHMKGNQEIVLILEVLLFKLFQLLLTIYDILSLLLAHTKVAKVALSGEPGISIGRTSFLIRGSVYIHIANSFK